MKLILNKKHPLGLKDQIKRQVRSLVDCGELSPGQALPSAKDMATLLSVNRNTVSAAYRDLLAEGLLDSIKGSGTFVKGGRAAGRDNELIKIFDEAFERAAASGYGPEVISEFLLTFAATHLVSVHGRSVLVIECNRETLKDICAILQRELGVEARGVLIQEIEESPALMNELIAGTDLIVCGFNHVEELGRAVPTIPVEVVAVMLKPDARIINELFKLPPGTRVGFTCANQRSTETFYKSGVFSGGSSLTRSWAGMDNPSKVREMLERCDVVFATHYVFDLIRDMAGPHIRVIEVEVSIDVSSINYIKERLNAVSGSWKGRTASSGSHLNRR